MSPANFELYLRTITLSILSLAIVAAALYQVIGQNRSDPTVLGWAAAIVGFYLGQHVTTNGARAARNAVVTGAEIEAHVPPTERETH